MDVELFVHGVPNGVGFWGKEEDRNYFSGFYDHSADEVKFLIQTRVLKGKTYCYYNYLVYKTVGSLAPNIVACDGRDGSYFGITLRLDAYCKDYDNMYRILDTLYNVYILGRVLKIEKTKLKYTAPDLASFYSTFKEIENTAILLIQKAFTPESFTNLESFATSSGKYHAFNLYDGSIDKIMSAIKQFGCVALSPYYISSREVALQQQCEAKIQAMQTQLEAQLKANAEAYTKEKSEISESLLSEKNRVSQLQNENRQKDDTISQLIKEKNQLQSNLNNVGQNKKISQIVAPLKGQVSELARLLERIAPEEQSNYSDNKRNHKRGFFKKAIKILPLLNFIILLSLVGILLSPLKNCSQQNATASTTTRTDSTNVEENEQQKKDSINGKESASTVSTFDINSVRIDIKKYKDGDLSLNTEYEVEVINGSPQGTWENEGCKITQSGDQIQMTPTAHDVTITYCVGNQKKTRKLTAK